MLAKQDDAHSEMLDQPAIPVPDDDDTTFLYRYYSAEGALLYVGVSLSAVARAAQHRAASHWYHEAVSMKFKRYPTRRAALDAEALAIAKEGPRYNVMGKRTPEQIKAAKLQALDEAAAARKMLIRNIVEFKPLYDLAGAADALGMTTYGVRKLMRSGDLDYRMVGNNPMVTGWEIINFVERLHQTKKTEL